MADGIRKPWLLDYLIAYAEQHGARLSPTRPKRGKVQIINFRTLPENPREWVWADVSDKQHTITVRFTMEAVQAFNDDPRNAGRRLTSRRWGVATIQCIQPLWCRPPAHAGKGLEKQMTLALVVDQIEIAGSEGEAMFGEPRSVTKEEPMRRWIEGLRDPHGAGGNILKQERLERQEKEKELTAANKSDLALLRRPLDAVLNVESHALRATGDSKKPRGHQRLRQWNMKMKELRLVLTHECHEIPKDQQQILKGIAVFGLDSPINSLSQVKDRVSEGNRDDSLCEPSVTPESEENKAQLFSHHSKPQNDYPQSPTTPSHWSASQRTNQDQELDNNEQPSHLSDDDPDTKAASGQNADDEVEEFQDQEDVFGEQALALPDIDDADDARIELPQREARRPVILVPDSDMSGSQSQSLSLTQPSISLPSQQKTREMIFLEPSSQDAVPEALGMPMPSEPWSSLESDEAQIQDEDIAEIDQLESDDEAAKRILNSGDVVDCRTSVLLAPLKHTTVNFEPANVSPLRDQVNESSTSRADRSPEVTIARALTPADGSPAASGSNGLPMPYNPAGTGSRGMKRTLGEMTTPSKGGEENERPFKRQQGKAQEVVVERVDHNAFAWKDPSFVRSRTKSEARNKEAKSVNLKRNHEMHHTISRTSESAQYRSTTPNGKRFKHDQLHPLASEVTVTVEASDREVPYTTSSTTAPGNRLRSMASQGASYPPHNLGDPSTSTSSAMAAPPLTLTTRPRGQPSSSQFDPAENSEQHRERSLGSRHSPPLSSTGSAGNMSSVHHKQKPLKLGGWRPREEIEPGLGIITWKDLNKILLTVGRVREQSKPK